MCVCVCVCFGARLCVSEDGCVCCLKCRCLQVEDEVAQTDDVEDELEVGAHSLAVQMRSASQRRDTDVKQRCG